MWLHFKGSTMLSSTSLNPLWLNTNSLRAGRFPESPSLGSKNTRFVFTSSFIQLYQHVIYFSGKLLKRHMSITT